MKDAMHTYAANLVQIDPNDVGIKKIPFTEATVGDAMGAVFIVVGAMAVLFILVGAARFSTANGEPAKISQARNTILFALVGLVLSTVAFAIVQFTLGRIGR